MLQDELDLTVASYVPS